MNLELRMFGLVNYQFTGMQKGIQFSHALQEYNNSIIKLLMEGKHLDDNNILEEINYFKRWSFDNKTVIVLNGGTTNTRRENDIYVGSLNNHRVTLNSLGINNFEFYETDIGDQLTAIVFILDERVFLRKKYPDFKIYLCNLHKDIFKQNILLNEQDLRDMFFDKEFYYDWVKSIGSGNYILGLKNMKIRDFINRFDLA